MPIIEELLLDDYSFEEAEAIQLKYQSLLKEIPKNKYFKNFKAIKTVVGVDISYYKKEKEEYGVACAVVWSLNRAKVESFCFAHDKIKFPYKPGFLGFRECKLLAKVILKLSNRGNIIMCDGHGKIHPKRFGGAVHLGYALDTPTIGVAKNPYIGYYNGNNLKSIKGNKSPIWSSDRKIGTENLPKELLGYIMCLKDGSKPVFISIGYKTTLKIALKVCLISTTEHRQPEPLYLADKFSRKEVINYF
jgi:deoxyribonuclease V